MIRPFDVFILLAGAMLVGMLGFNVYSGQAAIVEVMQGNDLHGRYRLSGSRTIEVSGPLGTTRIEIHEGLVRVTESPCLNGICIRSGWLDGPGDATACVPNRVSLVLLGDDTRFDAMSF